MIDMNKVYPQTTHMNNEICNDILEKIEATMPGIDFLGISGCQGKIGYDIEFIEPIPPEQLQKFREYYQHIHIEYLPPYKDYPPHTIITVYDYWEKLPWDTSRPLIPEGYEQNK